MNETDPATEEARRAGFDLNLIERNLALTPEERVLRHASALELAQALRAAGAGHAESSPLITAKEAVGREKDLLAAKELRAIAAKRNSDAGR